MENICIPMHVDAFALCPDNCNGDSKIAPITQPNYTALRLDSHLIQHDVVDHIDFHYASPPELNPRLSDLGSNPRRFKFNRMGIHLSWSLPRLYRTAKVSDSKADPNSPKDNSSPVYRPIPNRWLVTRHLHPKSYKPDNADIPEFQSWIIESDVIRKITEIPDTVDLETEVSPFVSYSGDANAPDSLKTQAEIFLGQKIDLAGWREGDPSRKHTKLTIMNSSNPLFPDYALHNTNVLSIIDNFAYKNDSKDADFLYLTQAAADYYVIGWHSDGGDDPLMQSQQDSLSDRLKTLLLQLDTGTTAQPDPKAAQQATQKDTTRCVSHAAIYNVQYNQATQQKSLADEAARKFTAQVKMEPLSLGTTPLDGILTFLEAHQADVETIFGQGTKSLASEILNLSQLLYATGDDYDSRVKAQDLISQQNFTKTEGGFRWTFSGRAQPGGAPATPSSIPDPTTHKSDVDYLKDLNEAQRKLDLGTRKLKSLQWELFAEWWKYVSEFIPDLKKIQRRSDYKGVVDPLIKAIKDLQGLCGSLQASVNDLKDKVACKKSARTPYFLRTDPTLCIAGLDSGWPDDFMDRLLVHSEHQFPDDFGVVNNIYQGNLDLLPSDHGLQTTIKRVLAQCLKNSDTQNITKTTGYQSWAGRNPFVPLFIEWESTYYHIDFNKWDVALRTSPVGHPNSQFRYGPRVNLASDPANQADARVLSGRVLVLPQPVFSLEATVLQVLNIDPSDPNLTTQQKQTVSDIRKFKFISAPLSGLTSHLLTRCEGAHVKPNVRAQGEKVIPLGAAVAASQDIDLDFNALKLIDAESALTPYGSLLDFGKMNYPGNPFKGVTHGQMLFTKLNIVDKFGQAICLGPPGNKPRLRHPTGQPATNIFPCLSDYLAPTVLNGQLNTVFPSGPPGQVAGDWPLCQFAQLTPSINQDARINASFLLRDPLPGGQFSAWREASDYEQPIWGWIIINYADYGLQFFLADGTFYREIRLGGPDDNDVSQKWLPFDPPAAGSGLAASLQLDQMIDQIHKEPKYLQSFFDVINLAIATQPFPPSEYAGFANAVVGKPLALVNVGWSLELSQPAITPQNSLGNKSPDSQRDLESYKFPVRIGDIDRIFDGVVGYYLTANNASPTATDFRTMFTYFEPSVKTDSFRYLSPDSPTEAYPTLSPYYVQPETTPNVTAAHASQYLITTALIDPYTSVHAYSPILPTKSLKLPAWTVQSAFDKMSAFFRLGPSLVTRDVPSSYGEAMKGAILRLPISGRKGLWRWHQPYDTNPADANALPQYAALEVEEDQGRVKFEEAPYTFVEGFLQLMGRLGKADLEMK